jgi:hypothetical protein
MYPGGAEAFVHWCGNLPGTNAAGDAAELARWNANCASFDPQGGLEGWLPYYTYSYALENHVLFLRHPGDWVIDTSAGQVYVVAPAGVSSAADLERLPVLAPSGNKPGDDESLVQIMGTANSPVSNLSFSGVTFSHTNWLYPYAQHGVTLYSASVYSMYAPKPSGKQGLTNQWAPAAFVVNYATNVSVVKCTFQGLGSDAIGGETGWGAAAQPGLTISGNVFADISGSAMAIRSYGATIQDNSFSNVGVEFAGAGIVLIAPKQVTVNRNRMNAIGSEAVMIQGWNNPASTGNVIADNHISSATLDLVDSAAIYANTFAQTFEQTHAPTLTIRHNLFEQTNRPTFYDDNGWYIDASIYFDGDSGGSFSIRGATIEENEIVTSNGQPVNLNCPGDDTVVKNEILATTPVPGRAAVSIQCGSGVPSGWAQTVQSGNGPSTTVPPFSF